VIGVTLIAAAIVIPPITARLLTDRLDRMILISMAVGALTAVAGIYLSYYVDTSSGATIVLTQTAVFLLAVGVNAIWKHNRLAAIHFHV
jgi:ABC-type Mn2+/Zn2+ transport system permease subunit